jgi:hypothetical protein
MADKNMVRCKVVGPWPVLDVEAPGEVDLDADVYNIDALVQAGHVEILKAAPKAGKATGAS